MKDKMSWEETILHIRQLGEYNELVKNAYFDSDLVKNVERFRDSKEFLETLKIIKKIKPDSNCILDIGSGNGISAVSFAIEGYNVKVIEPDSSQTVGAGAINFLKNHYKLENLEIYQNFLEDNQFDDSVFDIVYARQSMHHAYDLNKFVKEAARVLKLNGLFFTVRDHVIYDYSDKEKFLTDHPLHKYYGGENAFKSEEYREAIYEANLILKHEMKFFDNVINYFPIESEDIDKINLEMEFNKNKFFIKFLEIFSSIPSINYFSNKIINKYCPNLLDETLISGRMYSYIAIKE